MIDGPSDIVLAHYGVKGMKWGKRKARPSTSDIKGARGRHNARVSEIRRLDQEAALATTKSERSAKIKTMKKIAADANESGDVKLATTATRGDKVAATILLGPFGLTAVNSKMRTQEFEAQQLLTQVGSISIKDYER